MGRGRRCINPRCDRPLLPTEQGALCSGCFYEAICTPAPADTEPPAGTDLPGDTEAAPRWQRRPTPGSETAS